MLSDEVQSAVDMSREDVILHQYPLEAPSIQGVIRFVGCVSASPPLADGALLLECDSHRIVMSAAVF